MNNILERLHCEWWQALLLLIVLGMFPIFKAFATILVGRFVKPDLAKIALPLVLASRKLFTKKPPVRTDSKTAEKASSSQGT
jgi:hypothetical protein